VTNEKPKTNTVEKLQNPRSTGIVLLYHRINTLENDPWHLAVTPDIFDAQLGELNKQCTLLALSELGSTPKEESKIPIFITFDDGYLDNLEIAKPILEHHKTPSTFFITKSAIDAKKEFWWDALEYIVFNSSPSVLTEILNLDLLELNKKDKLRFCLPVTLFGKYGMGRKQRAKFYFYIWNCIYSKKSNCKSRIMENLHNLAQLSTAQRETHRTMITEDVSELSDSPRFDIAAHGVTHDALGELDSASALDEIRESHKYATNFSNKINTFSYPHGSVPINIEPAFSELGIDFAFTTQPEKISRDVLALEIPRLTVDNWPPDALMRRIKALIQNT